jgi:hypothetical protein
MSSRTKVALLWKVNKLITQQAPFPHRPRSGIWEGRGDRSNGHADYITNESKSVLIRESVTKSAT